MDAAPVRFALFARKVVVLIGVFSETRLVPPFETLDAIPGVGEEVRDFRRVGSKNAGRMLVLGRGRLREEVFTGPCTSRATALRIGDRVTVYAKKRGGIVGDDRRFAWRIDRRGEELCSYAEARSVVLDSKRTNRAIALVTSGVGIFFTWRWRRNFRSRDEHRCLRHRAGPL